MERTVKHLLLSVVVLCVAIAPQAMAQRSGSPPMQELIDAGSTPLDYGPSVPPMEPAYPTESMGPGAGQGEFSAPMASAFGSSESQWGQYQPPDYEDGLTSVAACCEICGHGANCTDTWAVEQRVTAWQRSKPRGIRVSQAGAFVQNQGQNVFQTNTILHTRSTTFDAAAGYGATVRRYWRSGKENGDLFLEGSYFGLNTWRERRAVNSSSDLLTNLGGGFTAGYGNLFTPFTDPQNGPTSGVGGFDRARHHEIYYESRLHNVELNMRLVPRARPDRIVLHPNGRWRRECQPGIYGSYLLGIRWFSLTEQFNFLSTGRTDIYFGNIDPANIIATVDTQGTYDIETFNDLLGLQFGMDLMYRRCVWGWGAEVKVSPCINFSSQRSHVATNAAAAGDPFVATDLDEFRFASSDDVALLGQVSILGYYDVHPNLRLRASWDIMWAVGVALAPEQLTYQTNPTPRVNTNGTAYYQGISLGLVWTH